MSRPLVIDCFLYNGEPIVKLRLSYLADHVDYFVITEARCSFTGKRKDELFYEKYVNIFEPYRAKIIFLEITDFPETTSAWSRESYQRDFPREAIIQKFGRQDYIVLCCDSDEIPSIATIELCLRNYKDMSEPFRIEMTMHYYNFDWWFNYMWVHPFVINAVGFARNGIQHYRNTGCIKIPRGGWHFSYFLGYNDIRKKLESFSHTEYDKEEYKSRANVKTCIEGGIDLFHRGHNLDRVPAELYHQYPAGWKELNDELKAMQL